MVIYKVRQSLKICEQIININKKDTKNNALLMSVFLIFLSSFTVDRLLSTKSMTQSWKNYDTITYTVSQFKLENHKMSSTEIFHKSRTTHTQIHSSVKNISMPPKFGQIADHSY